MTRQWFTETGKIASLQNRNIQRWENFISKTLDDLIAGAVDTDLKRVAPR